MSHQIQQAFAELKPWMSQARTRGWFTEPDLDLLNRIEQEGPDDLFAVQDRRPLVIGFFGGTGVGKSSLLNRLAGEVIAKVGVERPTSREVTLYLHESHDLATLPAEFPVDKTRITRHRNDSRRDVAWIDMPDMDSVELANRRLALTWLPYIDWIIYVVSPERYRDDAGWQILQLRGHRHRWLFVMNHWDAGTAEQIAEFADDLKDAGFDAPTVLRTSCVGNASNDDFSRLEQTIREAIESHGIVELQRLGVLAKMRDMAQLLDTLKTRFGTEQSWQRFTEIHRVHAQQIFHKLRESLRWPVEAIASSYRERAHRWFSGSSQVSTDRIDLSGLRTQLWSEQPRLYLEDVVSQAVLDTKTQGIASGAVQKSISLSLENTEEILLSAASKGLQRALATPGTTPQRSLRRFVRFLCYILPLAAVAWAAYNVTLGYQQAITGKVDFLGLEFAVHTLLLIFLAWLAPFILYRLLRPSLQTSARRGLHSGIDIALESLSSNLEQTYKTLGEERSEFLQSIYTPNVST